MKNIGKTIKLLRQLAGIPQKDLAKRISFSQNYISLIENGKKEPSLKLLRKLGAELNIPVSAFFWNDLEIDNISDLRIKETSKRINDLYWDLIRQTLSSKTRLSE